MHHTYRLFTYGAFTMLGTPKQIQKTAEHYRAQGHDLPEPSGEDMRDISNLVVNLGEGVHVDSGRGVSFTMDHQGWCAFYSSVVGHHDRIKGALVEMQGAKTFLLPCAIMRVLEERKKDLPSEVVPQLDALYKQKHRT